MTNENSLGDQPSEDVANLADDISMILNHPDKLTQIIRPPTLREWLRFIEEYLTQDGKILNEEMVKEKLDKLAATSSFSPYFPEDYRICATIIPCNSTKGRFDADDIRSGEFIQFLRIPPEGQPDKNIYERQQRLLYEFMPEEIRRECTFEIGKYEADPDGNDENAGRERARIMAKCAEKMMRHFKFAQDYFQPPTTVN